VEALQRHDFPGNVRELENVLERAFTLCDGGRIRPEDLQLSSHSPCRSGLQTAIPEAPRSTPTATDPAAPVQPASAAPDAPHEVPLPDGESLESFLEKIERHLITEALEATRWNKTAAARQLGITFRALRYRLKKLELE
jgi:two-component system response regulator PilR (NtrC family)